MMENPDKLVNGKYYPMWSQFVNGKDKFIGGVLEDLEDIGHGTMRTEVSDVELVPNGDNSAFFQVCGQDFSCGFDVEVGGIAGGEDGWLTFCGYGGHTWRIKPKKEPK